MKLAIKISSVKVYYSSFMTKSLFKELSHSFSQTKSWKWTSYKRWLFFTLQNEKDNSKYFYKEKVPLFYYWKIMNNFRKMMKNIDFSA